MNLAQLAGIPIALPGWTQVVAYIFLVLLALAVAVAIWRTIVTQKDRSKIGEIHARTELLLLIAREWQQSQPKPSAPLVNEHVAPERDDLATDIVSMGYPEGTYRYDRPQHGSTIK